MLQETKKIYTKLLKLMKENKDLLNWDLDGLETTAKLHLRALELQELGLNVRVSDVTSFDWIRVSDYESIAWYGSKYKRTISWLDFGDQPEDEQLYQISFPTGPFIFGSDYPTTFFQSFVKELLTYNPDYTDLNNKSFYWKVENAKEIFSSVESILTKYHDLNKEDYKQRKIAKMKEELQKLEG